MFLDEDVPVVVVCEPFEKNWFVSTTIEIKYHWVEILVDDEIQTVELERLTHIQ